MIQKVRWDGVEPPKLKKRVGYSHLDSPMPSQRMSLQSVFSSVLIFCSFRGSKKISGASGSRTRKQSRNFKFRRFSSLRTTPLKASPVGFEPTISYVTGRRTLQTAPRGRN